jgi:LmbE family N-acetylglucosaminyl deacetylase
MTILTSIILVLVIVAGTAGLAYYMQRGTKTLKEFKMDYDNNAEVQELADLAKELYNKDLRPVAPKTTIKKKKSEFPIDQPVKKDKVTEQVEAMKKVVEAHDTLVEEINKISPEPTPVQVEAVVEAPKPVRKKRKYYPKKK